MHDKGYDLMGYVDSTAPGQAILVLWNDNVRFRRMFSLEFMARFGIRSEGDSFLVRVTDEGKSPRLEFEMVGNVRKGGPHRERVLDISFLDHF